LTLLADLHRAGLVRLGEVSDGGFFEFPDPLDQVLEELGRTWTTKPEPQWWFACWLENTDDDRCARGGERPTGP
jgi:hypothetical protein